MNEKLMQIVIDMVEFFANCDDDILDPDEAVQKLEGIAYVMRQLSLTETDEFVRFTQEAAAALSEVDPAKAEFYSTIPSNLGIDL